MTNEEKEKSWSIGWHQYDGLAQELPFEPEESLAAQIRASLSRTIRKSSRSIEDLAEGLSRRLGMKITHHILRNMASESHIGHRFPLEWAVAWVQETGDPELVKIVLAALGLPLPKAGDARKIHFADARIRADLAVQEADGLKAQILRNKR